MQTVQPLALALKMPVVVHPDIHEVQAYVRTMHPCNIGYSHQVSPLGFQGFFGVANVLTSVSLST